MRARRGYAATVPGGSRPGAAGQPARERRRPGAGVRWARTAMVLFLILTAPGTARGQGGALPECDPDNGDITLPDGFCAVVVADDMDRVRHIAVDEDGDIYTTLSLSGVRTSLIGLRDTTGDGRADRIARFGEIGGSGVIVHDGQLYFATVGKLRPDVLPWFPLYRRDTAKALAVLGVLAAIAFWLYRRQRRTLWLVVAGVPVAIGAVLVLNVAVREVRQLLSDRVPYRDHVLRYTLPADDLAPTGRPDTIVRGLPTDGGHYAKGLVIDDAGRLYVSVGSSTNACAEESQVIEPTGIDPCPERAVRAGIWRFDADREGQTQADGEHYATGLRNTFAMARDPATGEIYAIPHGRDGLSQYWPEIYEPAEGARQASEQMFLLEEGADYGWPYCYHDPDKGHQILAPEYGGDGEVRGRCAETEEPVLAFPAHWAPMDMVFYTGEQFPERYRGGAFVAFHGSANRPPLPQEGYHVVFVPFEEGRPAGYEVFAHGFEGEIAQPGLADHRPSGVATGPDGSLYVVDDKGGRIWRIVYTGSDVVAAAGEAGPG